MHRLLENAYAYTHTPYPCSRLIPFVSNRFDFMRPFLQSFLVPSRSHLFNSQKICFLPAQVFIYGQFSILFYDPSISFSAYCCCCCCTAPHRLWFEHRASSIPIGWFIFGFDSFRIVSISIRKYSVYLFPCFRLFTFLLIFNININIDIRVMLMML